MLGFRGAAALEAIMYFRHTCVLHLQEVLVRGAAAYQYLCIAALQVTLRTASGFHIKHGIVYM